MAVFNEANEDFSIPRGQQTIKEGDELYLISTAGDIKKVVEILTKKA